MTASVEAELKNLLAYFGEKTDTPEATKPEDFFALILSFSSSLQVRSGSFTVVQRINVDHESSESCTGSSRRRRESRAQTAKHLRTSSCSSSYTHRGTPYTYPYRLLY